MSKRHCAIAPKGTLTDYGLMEFFDRLEASGTVRDVFYGGDAIATRDTFVAYMRRPDVLFVGLLWDAEPSGFLILDRFEGRWARIHFGVFKPFWGHKAKAMCRFGVAHLLYWQHVSGAYMFDGFLGITPEGNRLAQRFIQQVGAKVYCTIPGVGAISHTSRDTVNKAWMEA